MSQVRFVARSQRPSAFHGRSSHAVYGTTRGHCWRCSWLAFTACFAASSSRGGRVAERALSVIAECVAAAVFRGRLRPIYTAGAGATRGEEEGRRRGKRVATRRGKRGKTRKERRDETRKERREASRCCSVLVLQIRLDGPRACGPRDCRIHCTVREASVCFLSLGPWRRRKC